MIGGAKDITRIFTERMLEPNGLKSGDYDYIFAGATSARFSALQSGAVDAAILTVPFNFYAESAGFTNLGFTFDYIPDMPFAGDGGEPHLGRRQSEGGRALPRRASKRASPGSRTRKPRRSREADGRAQQAQAGGRREILRFPARASTCSSRPARSRSRKLGVVDSMRSRSSATSRRIFRSSAWCCRA